jgi:hypothetical protein
MDIVAAIVEVLKAEAAVTALAGEHIYGGELPPGLAGSMPRGALVVQPSGGAPYAPDAKLPLEAQRVDVVAYGATLKQAVDLRSAAGRILINVERQVISGGLVHWVKSAGGYLTGRDRDGAWPYAFQSFQSLFATDEVA